MEQPKIKVDAVIGYEIRGVKSFKSIVFEIDHWSMIVQGMQKTKEWMQVRDLLFHNSTCSHITGITFNFIRNAEIHSTTAVPGCDDTHLPGRKKRL